MKLIGQLILINKKEIGNERQFELFISERKLWQSARYISLVLVDFEVLQAGDGATAIELLAVSKPDFLLVDLLLPRINGLQVLEYAHKASHLDQLQIAIITAHSDFRRTYSLGRNESFLLKPVTATMLRDVARQAIAASPKTL